MFSNRKVLIILLVLLLSVLDVTSATGYAQATNAPLSWTLSGTIYGGGTPLADATVILHDASTADQIGETATDVNGFYSFAVSDGTYNITIVPPSGSGFSQSIVNGIVVNGGNVTQNVVLIAQAFSISGVVRYPDGTVAPNINVRVNGTSGETGGNATTDTSGVYTIPVSSGTFNIMLRGGSYWGQQAKPSPHYYQQEAIINLVVSGNVVQDLTLPPFTTISGQTTDANGVAIGNVHLSRQSAGFYLDDKYTQIWDETVYSDAAGEYSMVVLPYDNYSFTAYPPSGRTDLLQTSYVTVHSLKRSTGTINEMGIKW